MKNINDIKYIIVNPTENLTALVETYVDKNEQATIARIIMEKEKKVEQVGFLSYKDDADIVLRMAGGEFCGNATMSAAAYLAKQNNTQNKDVNVYILDDEKMIKVKVEKKDDCWHCTEEMPKAISIQKINIDLDKGLQKDFTIVNFKGISHIIFADEKRYDEIDDYEKRKQYDVMIRNICKDKGLSSIGFIFYSEKSQSIKPLVYVNEIDTLFLENSCASGTAALGMYLYSVKKEKISIDVKQPKGILSVEVDSDKTILSGNVKFL